MKKTVAFLLALMMIAVLSGCGDDGAKESSKVESDLYKQEEQVFEEREIPVKDITVYLVGEPNDWYKAAAQNYKQKYGGTVAFETTTWDMRNTKLQQYIQSGDSPDIVEVFYQDSLLLMAQDLLTPLDGKFNASNKSYDLEQMKSSYSYMDSIYGIVQYKENKDPYFLLYNTDLFKAVSVDTPDVLYDKGQWNWETFRKTAKDVTQVSDGKTAVYGFGTYQDEIFAVANGANPLKLDGNKLVMDLESTPVREALDFLYKMVNVEKSTVPGIFDALPLWNAGKLAMTLGNASLLRTSKDSGLNVNFVPFPQGPSADKLYSLVIPRGFCVPKGAKSLEGGLAFAEILCGGFPGISEKYDAGFTEKEREYNKACNQNVVATSVNSSTALYSAWTDFTSAIRNNTPVGTAVGSHKNPLQKAADDLMAVGNK